MFAATFYTNNEYRYICQCTYGWQALKPPENKQNSPDAVLFLAAIVTMVTNVTMIDSPL